MRVGRTCRINSRSISLFSAFLFTGRASEQAVAVDQHILCGDLIGLDPVVLSRSHEREENFDESDDNDRADDGDSARKLSVEVTRPNRYSDFSESAFDIYSHTTTDTQQ